jgi:magnesium-transporting ATPase (P-type)
LIAGIIGFYTYKDDKIMPYFVGAGFLTGILVDILFLRRLINKLFDLPVWLLAGLYILGNVFIYGMFMGFPVFNILMGIVAGYYYGRKILVKNTASPQRETLIRNVSLFTALIMVFLCLSSAYIGLREKTIGEELQGMFRLGFVPQKGLIIAGIIIGGAMLITAQYYITRLTISKTIKHGGFIF